MMRRRLIALWRKCLHPFPQLPLLQTYLYSPLDRIAEQQGFPAVETAFATNPTLAAITKHFGAFLGENDPSRCLRKDLLCVFERRLRAVALHYDPAEQYGYGVVEFGGLGHPLDRPAAKILSQASGRDLKELPKAATSVKAGAALIAWGLSLLVGVLVVWLRFGRREIVPRKTQVAAPHFLSNQLMQRLRQACIEQGSWRDDALLFIQSQDFHAETIGDVVKIAELPVVRREWMSRVVLPAFRLVPAIWLSAFGAFRDPIAVEVATRALNLAYSSLPIWRMAMNVRCRWLIDVADYSAVHNLCAMIMRKWGGDVVRWPYTETEGPGLGFQYLDYGAYLAGGSYHHRTYGGSWRPDCRAVPVGLSRNDQVLNEREDAFAEQSVRSAIESRIAAGQRMMVFFANNELPGFNEAALTLFATIWPLVKGRSDWFLLIKPKKVRDAGGFFDRLYGDSRMIGLTEAENVLVSDFPDPVTGKTNPPAWLIDRMSLGITLPSTIQAESLTRSKPTVAFFPVIQDTPLTRVLFANGLEFTDAAALGDTIARYMDGAATISLPISWIKETWDPFADGQVMDRIASFLFLDQVVEPSQKATPV